MKKIKYILSFAILSYSIVYGQIKAVEDADLLFSGGEYKTSMKMYESFETQLKHKDLNWYYKIGEAKFKLKDYVGAADAYAKVIDHKHVPVDVYLHYGHVLRYTGRHNDAKVMYQKFHELHGKKSIDNYVQGCDLAMQKNIEINPKYVVNQTNMHLAGYYFGSAPYKEGIVYSIPEESVDKKTGLTYPNYKFVYSKVQDGQIISTEDFSSFKTPFYIGSPTFSADGNTMYFVMNESDQRFSHAKKYSKHGIGVHGVNTLNIFETHRTGDTWSEPVDLAFNSADFSNIHPCLSHDGTRMIMASNKAGGKGGYDLYVSTKQGNNWSAPISLGNDINSEDDEMFPFFYNDTTIYFASNGHIGYGGADIFVSYYTSGHWNKPINMGRTFNSEKDDFGLEFDSPTSGFFASNRNTEPGKDEILSFKKNIVYAAGKGDVSDALYLKKVENAEVDIYEGNVLIATVYTDKKGDFNYSKFDTEKKYTLHVKKDGYQEKEMEVDPLSTDLNKLDFKLDPVITKATTFDFYDILFEYGKADLLPESKEVLDRLGALLQSNPNVKVELSAHTDSRGSNKSNATLSQKRAQSCVDYLVSKGLHSENFVAKGWGEEKLKNECKDKVNCTEDQHAINRRVEIKVLDIK